MKINKRINTDSKEKLKFDSDFNQSDNDAKKFRDISPVKIMRNQPFTLKNNNVFQRTLWTIILLMAFILIILAGPSYCALLVLLLTIGIFDEIISLKRDTEREKQMPYNSMINFYFLFVGVFFFYGKLFSSKLSEQVFKNQYIEFIISYHGFITYILWTIGFLFFVISLKHGYYRYQLRQFGVSHLLVCLIVAQTGAIAQNIFEGLIWFVLPALLVVTNDIFAYIFGKLFGKTQLISLSPNKTLEGFIGGFICTIIFAVIVYEILNTKFSEKLQKLDHLVCPKFEFTFNIQEFQKCDINPIFTKPYFNIPFTEFTMTEFQYHSIFLSLFASFISPFGGFFSSGFKRRMKIKDYAATIPGHGGITDRMDCQILMGMFTNVYIHHIVVIGAFYNDLIYQYILSMQSQEQVSIYYQLKDILIQKNLLNNNEL